MRPGSPVPRTTRRTPACRIDVPGAIRVCDLFNKPLILSFWFTRGGDCEDQEDVFDRAYRRYSERVNFLAIDVRGTRTGGPQADRGAPLDPSDRPRP